MLRPSRGRPWGSRGGAIFLQVLLACLLAHRGAPGAAQECGAVPGDVVLVEKFDGVAAPGLLFPGTPGATCGGPAPEGANAACIDDLARTNGGSGKGRLVLTGAHPSQLGYVWVDHAFDLRTEQVAVSFDLYIHGGSSPPADGLSVIFQLGADASIHGRSGGALGTGGLPADYLSVAFDIWDNGDTDPEGPCDGVSARTCHVEVNRGSDPEHEPSLLVSTDVPSFIQAGNAGRPVHATIVLNDREILVRLETDFDGYGARDVIHALLPEAPAASGSGTALLGLAAATGSATAVHAVDNLCVSRAPAVPPRVELEPAVERGGINCGGPPVAVTWLDASFALDGESAYGDVAEILPGSPATFVMRAHGRLPAGDDHMAVFRSPIGGLLDASLEPVYQTEAWSREEVLYRHDVVPGRYRVVLLMAENCPCGVDREGGATRRYDVEVQGHAALRFFSPAEAAGREAGICRALLAAAVSRELQVDASPYADGRGVLEVRVVDLGGGSPPGEAQLNGFLFERLGDATGEPLQGEIEDHRPPAASSFEGPSELLALDFEGLLDGTLAAEALRGRATVTFAGPGPIFLQFQPIITGGRLRLVEDGLLASATSVVFDGGGALVFDPLATRVRATFDVFVSNAAGAPPADGLVFAIVEGKEGRRLGGAGGSLGFAGMGAAAVGVEVDLWEGGGFGDDSGFNTDGRGHLAVVGSGAGPATVDHVQDQNDFDPELDGAGWVDLLAPAGFRVEVAYEPQGRVEAFLESLDGAFARRQVLGTFVTPFRSHEAVLGFFAATGGETATIEVDDLRVETSRCLDAPETARIAAAEVLTVGLGEDGTAAIELDGSASSGGPAGSGEEGQALEHSWTVSGPFAGAEIERPCEPATRVTFAVPGRYEVSLAVDDRRCGVEASARDTVVVVVRPASGPVFLRGDTNCDARIDISDAVNTLNVLFLGTGAICCGDSGDTNDDGSLDITDAIIVLNYLFLGGLAPREPFPLCGGDPTEDALDCPAPAGCE